MIPNTTQRVPLHTSDEVNARIRDDMHERLQRYRYATPEAIEHRLAELDAEWDIERMLEANAAAVAFAGCVLTAARGRRWVALPMAVSAFLFQHAVQGWCPPLPILRRMGFRTMREIDEERDALLLILNEAQRGAGDYGGAMASDVVAGP